VEMGLQMLRKIRHRIQGVLLSLVSSSVERRLTLGTGEQLDDITNSGFLGKVKIDTATALYQRSREANLLYSQGHYSDAVRIHHDCLQDVYRINEVTDQDWTPKFLSYYFGAFLGHRALIALIIASQRMGFINSQPRVILHSGGQNEEQLKILFSNTPELTLLKSSFGYRTLEGPFNWHLSERLWMIKTREGFLETQRFTDYAFQKLNSMSIGTQFHFGEEYRNRSIQILEEHGLPSEQPFIALHVRKKNWNSNDIRKADIRNYIPAVYEALKRGYVVIQIGTDPQDAILNDPKVIVIQGDTGHSRFLTPFVLANAKLLINTCSGPSYLAAIFGTPVLQTNVIAFGKSATTLSPGSIHLPKKWVSKGKKVGLYDLLTSPLGYSYQNLKKLYESEIIVEENSASEIANATSEILDWIELGKSALVGDTRVNEIRNEAKAPTHGTVSSSFLVDHGHWFLQ
jgi:putative glycosyltransferase (TIGR04372 family)